MTATECCTETEALQPQALNLGSIVAAKVSAFLRAIRNRRELYHLGEMSDVELADIGLRRGDLFEAVETPVHVDPTGRLGAIAGTRARDVLERRIN